MGPERLDDGRGVPSETVPDDQCLAPGRFRFLRCAGIALPAVLRWRFRRGINLQRIRRAGSSDRSESGPAGNDKIQDSHFRFSLKKVSILS